RVYDRFRAETPGKEAYINLLPMYASADQLMFGADVQKIDYYTTDSNTYADHLDAYCKKFDTPYVCVDVYPCTTAPDGKTRTLYPGYLENLSELAHVCRKYDRELWIMVQSLIWYANATPPDEIDLRWQFHTVMAFGAAAIFHYCLATPPGHSPGLVDSEGKGGPLFYPAQRFHRYFKSVEDTYLSYKNVGCFNVNCDDAHPYLKFEEQYRDFAAIEEVVSDDQLLVGCFEKKEGSGSAFVLVNMTQISERKTAHVKLKLKDAKRVTAHLDNITVDLAPVDGYYEFTLPCGEGAFVTID
nr:hypothetical protein [Clostridia bacterium]